MEFGSEDTIVDALSIMDLPDLVIGHLLDKLDLSHLKSLREVCCETKRWVDNYTPFFDKFYLNISTEGKLLELLDDDTLIDQPKFLTTVQLNMQTGDFYSSPRITEFLHHVAPNVKCLRIVNYPFQSMDPKFLVDFTGLQSLEFLGTWAIAVFLNETWTDTTIPSGITKLYLRLSTAGLGAEKYKQFSVFLNRFKSLKSLKIYCEENQQLLFRQIPLFYALRYQTANIACLNDDVVQQLDEYASNPDSSYFPDLRNLCEFCCELEFDLARFSNAKKSFEDNFYTSIVGLKTIWWGHNVTFPFYKLQNVSSMTIFMTKFNCTESFLVGCMCFPHLKTLHLPLKQDFELIELQKSLRIFAHDQNAISELTIELPKEELVKLGSNSRNEIVSSFLTAFPKLKTLKVHNQFSPIWLLPPQLARLQLYNILSNE